MKTLLNLAMTIPLAAAMMFSQQQQQPQKDTQADQDRQAGQADVGSAKTYHGTIVDANCTQASDLTSASNKAKAKSDVMKHCQASSTTTSFALLTNDGSFFKLDDGGNGKLTSMSDSKKNMKATVTGTVEGDTLKVQTLAKM